MDGSKPASIGRAGTGPDPGLPANTMSFLGVLMLETQFPRPLGDIGNAQSFAMPVRHRVVRGATAQAVVHGRAQGLLGAFVDAARELVSEGAVAIATSCGFMALMQRELQAALPVPVWTSSLLWLAELSQPGVITIDATALRAEHFRAVGADTATPIEGITTTSALYRTLMQDQTSLDMPAAETEVLAAAARLLHRHPGLQTLVLECTNLPPYADALRRATGLPVHDVLTLVHQRWQALKSPM